MSILSRALEKIGVPISTQKAVTGAAGAALAPVTGGISVLISTAAKAGASQAKSVIQTAAQDAANRVDAATATVKAADAAATAQASLSNMNPLLLIGGGMALALIAARAGGD